MHEALELWHRYCEPSSLGLDLCTGTCVSILAMLHLGLKGIVNDRDADAVKLGVARARRYLDHLYEEAEYQYPRTPKRHHSTHDGTDLYAWIAKSLGLTQRQAATNKAGSTTMVLPPSNIPYNLKINMTDSEWEQVLVVVGVCFGWSTTY
jgi:hypothetical protein